MRATACILSLAEAEAEAGVEDSAEDGSIVDIVVTLLSLMQVCASKFLLRFYRI